jgi:hypothetical protein
MKTHNYNIDLITPMQIDKDIVFNEALLMLDNFCNSTVVSFIATLPSVPAIGKKYILSAGENIGRICYCSNLSKGWQLLAPQDDMVMFVHKENNFFIFEQNGWKSIDILQNNAASQKAFIGIDTHFVVPRYQKSLYLYLNNNCTINFTESQEVTLILKQNTNSIYQLSYSNNIRWKDKVPHKMTENINAIDIIKFYPLIETNDLLAEIIGQNY